VAVTDRLRAGRIAGVVIALVVTACAPGRRLSSDAAGLHDADGARMAAMVHADADRLAAVLDDDLTYTHSNGRVDTKASLVAALVSGRIDYRVIVAGDTRARVFGSAGIVTGPVHIEVAAGGRVHRIEGAYTATYWWRAGRWRLVAYHSSPNE
jgi:hypothetical protein